MELAQDSTLFLKRKRTKRQRLLSPLSLALPATTSSSAGGTVFTGSSDDSDPFDHVTTSTTTSEFIESAGKEEEDMANCLILLARGRTEKLPPCVDARSGGRIGFVDYQCKTCNRVFSSFQALGGHRASHNKPKAVTEGKKDEFLFISNMNTTLPLQIERVSTKSKKFHECSICGVVFSSGQALGGHMRRHRSLAGAPVVPVTSLSVESSSQEFKATKKGRNNYPEFDLNLPAEPEDGHMLSSNKFSFWSKEQVTVFDCHY